MPSSPDTIQKTPVFSGEFRPLLDEKKRLTIPARWRSAALDDIFIVKSLHRGCLAAMPQAVLLEMGEKAGGQQLSVADHQAFKDHFFASAVTCPIDSQGRLVLGDDLCRFAGIKKEVVVAGGGSKFDIWSPELWAAQTETVEPMYKTVLRSLGL
jgi:MraZ protein